MVNELTKTHKVGRTNANVVVDKYPYDNLRMGRLLNTDFQITWSVTGTKRKLSQVIFPYIKWDYTFKVDKIDP